MAEYHTEKPRPEKCLNREKFIYKQDLAQIVKWTAELLNKQDLCTREKPAEKLFQKRSARACKITGENIMSIKKMPELLWDVFNTQADESRIEADSAFIKYFSPLLGEDVLLDLVDILDFQHIQ